jgi:ATP-dependent DNA ligase
MLGKLVRELPVDGYVYEPKWDGFRCLAFRCGGEVDLRSRHDRPFARYFPEVVEGVGRLGGGDLVLDGEIVVTRDGRFDFPALMGRLHPAASRVARLARETPARFVAFDLLAAGGEDLRGRPFAQRRAALEALLGDEPPAPLDLTPSTGDPGVARRWLTEFTGAGLDGVMAKPRDAPYEPGARTMLKVKHDRTADCVVAGWRFYADEPIVGSLLLGLYDAGGTLVHVGVTTAFTKQRRRELVDELRPLAAPLEGHPWEHGYLLHGGAMGRLGGAAARWDPREHALDWVPLRIERVVEVAYTQVDDGRFRHPAKFRRWRPDREPRSCTLEQL